jgi:Flp pilus assembly protein TadD
MKATDDDGALGPRERSWILDKLGSDEEAVGRALGQGAPTTRAEDLLARARVLMRSGRDRWAEDLLRAASRLLPASCEAWTRLALVLMRLGREHEAREAASWAVMLESHASDRTEPG